MQKILVTGCAGFIGSHLTRSLLNKNLSVIGIDNLNDYYNPEWKKENIQDVLQNELFTFFHIDIFNTVAIEKIIQDNQPDVIVHLAAQAGVRNSLLYPHLYEEVNIKGTLNILEAARKFNLKKIVFASSSSVYGKNAKIPFSETDVTDSPESVYAATKKSTELMCYSYSALYDMSLIGLRFFTVYGPSGRPDMAPYMFTELILNNKPISRFGDGTTSRDYTYIGDIVDGIERAMVYETKFDIFNLGNNHPIQLNDFIHTLEEVSGKQAVVKEMPMQPGDVPMTYADISKANQLLGYQPKTTLKEGLASLVDWYKRNRMSSDRDSSV